MPKPTLLIISQIYRPDPAAVGQYLADVGEAMVHRGWRVVVFSANRGFDDPTVVYATREQIAGVDVVRLPFSSFGKRSISVRMAGGLLFIAQSVLRALCIGRVDVVLVSTTPPVSPLAALGLTALRRIPSVYWLMDLNPDQYVALGHASAGAAIVRAFDWMNCAILRSARTVVVLDRFMMRLVLAKLDVPRQLRIIPPWSRDQHLFPVAHADNMFRETHQLTDKFVVMYSGNHGPSNPLTTLLEAAHRLRDDPRIAFVFIGGGVGKGAVDLAARANRNILSLPYQPMEDLSWSLSAGDVHAVTMGNEVVGIVHPSKVYGAFAVERPVLFIGPKESHIGDILAQGGLGWQVEHGDVEEVVRLVTECAGKSTAELAHATELAMLDVRSRFASATLCEEFCDIVEAARLPAKKSPQGNSASA